MQTWHHSHSPRPEKIIHAETLVAATPTAKACRKSDAAMECAGSGAPVNDQASHALYYHLDTGTAKSVPGHGGWIESKAALSFFSPSATLRPTYVPPPGAVDKQRTAIFLADQRRREDRSSCPAATAARGRCSAPPAASMDFEPGNFLWTSKAAAV